VRVASAGMGVCAAARRARLGRLLRDASEYRAATFPGVRLLRTYKHSRPAPHLMARTGDYAKCYGRQEHNIFDLQLLTADYTRFDHEAQHTLATAAPLRTMLAWSEYAPHRGTCLICGKWYELRAGICRRCCANKHFRRLAYASTVRRAWRKRVQHPAPIVEVYPDGRLLVFSGSRVLASALALGYRAAEAVFYWHPDVEELPPLQPLHSDHFGYWA